MDKLDGQCIRFAKHLGNRLPSTKRKRNRLIQKHVYPSNVYVCVRTYVYIRLKFSTLNTQKPPSCQFSRYMFIYQDQRYVPVNVQCTNIIGWMKMMAWPCAHCRDVTLSNLFIETETVASKSQQTWKECEGSRWFCNLQRLRIRFYVKKMSHIEWLQQRLLIEAKVWVSFQDSTFVSLRCKRTNVFWPGFRTIHVHSWKFHR